MEQPESGSQTAPRISGNSPARFDSNRAAPRRAGGRWRWSQGRRGLALGGRAQLSGLGAAQGGGGRCRMETNGSAGEGGGRRCLGTAPRPGKGCRGGWSLPWERFQGAGRLQRAMTTCRTLSRFRAWNRGVLELSRTRFGVRAALPGAGLAQEFPILGTVHLPTLQLPELPLLHFGISAHCSLDFDIL